MPAEIVISTSSTDPTSYIWNLRSGTVLGSFKGNKCDADAIAFVKDRACIWSEKGAISAQNIGALIGYWGFNKSNMAVKMPLLEKISALAVSNSGEWCIGGGMSGTLYVWHMATGELRATFDAHYKQVTAIAFTVDDHAFITVGQDSTIHMWMFSAVLTPTSTGAPPTPRNSLSGHTLPITSLTLSKTLCSSVRIYTTSLDRTCKIWDTTPQNLLTLLYPKPLTCSTVDSTETRLYCGTSTGTIYQSNLCNALPVRTVADAAKYSSEMNSHTACVSGMSLSMDGSLLVSGSEDGKAIVWDTVSRQAIRVFTQHAGPITNVQVLLQAPGLMDANVDSVAPPQFKRYVTDGQQTKQDASSSPPVPPRPSALESLVEQRLTSGLGRLAAKQGEDDELGLLRQKVMQLSRRNGELKEIGEELLKVSCRVVTCEL
ncbi:WD40-repeat-containing domain protein [Gaertneriomyces semiglobifer]|nr:WD40-repeat-containing domain protein [Gaertneriomyces semiglobifer]